jgi:hypothetical protein
MTTILIDHNLEGQAALLMGTFVEEGWADLFLIRFVTLQDVGLSEKSNDRIGWRFVQTHQMLLLTDNRNMKGRDSLQQTLQEENMLQSLPVLTIGNIHRMVERTYRERCVARLAEILYDLEKYRGTHRIFIP